VDSLRYVWQTAQDSRARAHHDPRFPQTAALPAVTYEGCELDAKALPDPRRVVQPFFRLVAPSADGVWSRRRIRQYTRIEVIQPDTPGSVAGSIVGAFWAPSVTR